MKIHRLYADKNGDSHFADVEIELTESTRAARLADQHAARRRDDPALRQRAERGEEGLELRLLGHPPGEGPGADAHPECAPRLPDRDLGTDDARAVLPGERLEVSPRVEDGDGQRRAACRARLPERRLHDDRRLVQGEVGHVDPPVEPGSEWPALYRCAGRRGAQD